MSCLFIIIFSVIEICISLSIFYTEFLRTLKQGRKTLMSNCKFFFPLGKKTNVIIEVVQSTLGMKTWIPYKILWGTIGEDQMQLDWSHQDW